MLAQKCFSSEGFVAPCQVLWSLAKGEQQRGVTPDVKRSISISYQFSLMGEQTLQPVCALTARREAINNCSSVSKVLSRSGTIATGPQRVLQNAKSDVPSPHYSLNVIIFLIITNTLEHAVCTQVFLD